MRTLSRILGKCILLLLLISCALLLLLSWVAFSQTGTQWAFGQTKKLFPDELSISSINGALARHLVIDDLSWSGEINIYAEQISLHWHLMSLFENTLEIDSLTFSEVSVTLPEKENTTQENTLSLPFSFNIPIEIKLANLSIDKMNILAKDKRQDIERIQMRGEILQHQVNIEIVEAIGPEFTAGLKADFATIFPFNLMLMGAWLPTYQRLPEY